MSAPRILFAFENPLPSREADAEVFTTTAAYLAASTPNAALHVPVKGQAATPPILPTIRAQAPLRPAILRHFCCGLTIVTRKAFRDADLVYTRNLWVAAMALLFGQRVVFDHYRPWPDQIPPLQSLLRALMGHRRFLLNICHSDYTRARYLALGIDPARLVTIRNGWEPDRLRAQPSLEAARQALGIPEGQPTAIYTGRINHKKGLDVLIEAAARRPDILFLLVGATGQGPIEALARTRPNIRLIPWQDPQGLALHLAAADILVIPPSTRPLAEFGSTVLPLKLFLYMASGRPILAGATQDVQEVLRHRHNAYLCPPDDPDALAAALSELIENPTLAASLGATAATESLDLTWDARASRILAAIDERRHAPPARSRRRTPAERRTSRARSRQWLIHLVRTRSVVLPPEPA